MRDIVFKALIKSRVLYVGVPLIAAGYWKQKDADTCYLGLLRKCLCIPIEVNGRILGNVLNGRGTTLKESMDRGVSRISGKVI